jgi:putative tricarboxylic transport membrane protein
MVPFLALEFRGSSHGGVNYRPPHPWCQAGPLLISEQPQIFWGLIASMYIGNVILLVLNLRWSVFL